MDADGRVGLYYCPREDDPLFAAGASWLGRNPASGAPVSQPGIPGIEAITAEPRAYGFHATLKPPMRLTLGRSWSELERAVETLARQIAPFTLPKLAVTNVQGFLALREALPSPPLQALADACVMETDEFRAPASEAELARRRRTPLTASQEAMLVRYGYPYVLSTWFFHMTLTGRLSPDEHVAWRPAAERFFAMAVAAPRVVTEICLFTQRAPGAPFVIARRVPLSPGV
jgi:putative phosphonate metabolism protein